MLGLQSIEHHFMVSLAIIYWTIAYDPNLSTIKIVYRCSNKKNTFWQR